LGHLFNEVSGTSTCNPVAYLLCQSLASLFYLLGEGCLRAMENLFKQGDYRVSQLFNLVKVKYIETEEIDGFDPEHLSFFNINNQDDLERARKLATEKL